MANVQQAPNMNPTMGLIAPDIQAQQVALQRQQQMADMLRQQGVTPIETGQMVTGAGPARAVPVSGWQALAKVLQGGIGGYMQQKNDAQGLDLAKQYQGRIVDLLRGGSATGNASPAQAQPDQTANTPMPAMPIGSGMSGTDASSTVPNDPVGAAQLQAAQAQPQAAPAAQQQPAPPPASDRFGLANLLRGSVIGQIGGDDATKAFYSDNAPTDFAKALRQSGIDPNSTLGRQVMQQNIAKQNNIPLVAGRAGAPMYDAQGRVVSMTAKIPDNAIPQIVDGRVVGVSALPGAADVEQINAYAGAAGKNQAEPIAGFQNGAPVYTNKLDAAQGGAPGQSSPVNAGRFGGYAAPGGGAVTPGLAPGIAAAAEGQAAQNTKRSGALVDASADSPTRVNVLDNILSLSNEGAGTGPTAEWTNKVKGVLGSVPGFSGWKDDVTGYQEMKKFLNQNAIRAWSAAGGTGTDSQMSAAMQANPNDKMFPAAVQKMATWAKAGELALQSKSSAQDDWLARNQNNPAAQNQFESAWRKNFDPRIYQMKLMQPAELQAFAANMPANDRAALMQKYSAAKQNGWIQ